MRRMRPINPPLADPYVGGKPVPPEWLRADAKASMLAGHAPKLKAKRRAAGKRARAARKVNR